MTERTQAREAINKVSPTTSGRRGGVRTEPLLGDGVLEQRPRASAAHTQRDNYTGTAGSWLSDGSGPPVGTTRRAGPKENLPASHGD